MAQIWQNWQSRNLCGERIAQVAPVSSWTFLAPLSTAQLEDALLARLKAHASMVWPAACPAGVIKCNLLSCRNPDIAVNLMGMVTPEEVETDIGITLEALGLKPSKETALEEAVLRDVQGILKPVMNTTWTTGRQDNRTP